MTEDKKVKATADIYYEAMMLHRVFSEYWQSEPRAPKTWQHNAFLEATLLHTRSMLDFFEGSRTGSRRAHPDDIIAADYAFSSELFPFTSDLRERINKRIAHLTYSRIEVREEDKHWEFTSFLRPILDRCRDFSVIFSAQVMPCQTGPATSQSEHSSRNSSKTGNALPKVE